MTAITWPRELVDPAIAAAPTGAAAPAAVSYTHLTLPTIYSV